MPAVAQALVRTRVIAVGCLALAASAQARPVDCGARTPPTERVVRVDMSNSVRLEANPADLVVAIEQAVVDLGGTARLETFPRECTSVVPPYPPGGDVGRWVADSLAAYDGLYCWSPVRKAMDCVDCRVVSDGVDEESNTDARPVVDGAARGRIRVIPPDRTERTGGLVGPVYAAEPDPVEAVVEVSVRGRWACSGVVVGRDAVLTAAHCLPADRVGVSDGLGEERVLRVLAATRAPWAASDLALLRVDGDLGLPPALFRGEDDTAPPTGMVRHVGYGVQAVSGFGIRHPIELPAQGWGCDDDRAWTGCHPSFDLVIPGIPGADTCNGDSGGAVLEPVHWSDDGGPVEVGWGGEGDQCDWRVIGITSRAVPGAPDACAAGGIYARVDVAAGWIANALESNGNRREP